MTSLAIKEQVFGHTHECIYCDQDFSCSKKECIHELFEVCPECLKYKDLDEDI